MEEGTVTDTKLSEEDFFSVLNLDVKDVVTIAWRLDRELMVVLKRDGSRVKYNNNGVVINDVPILNWLLTMLPDNWEFAGFQHDDNGGSYDAFIRNNKVQNE